MAKRMFEFRCSCGIVSEALVESTCRTINCVICDKPADRIISAPRIDLDGTDPGFPGAYAKWAKKHSEKSAKANAAVAEHGSE